MIGTYLSRLKDKKALHTADLPISNEPILVTTEVQRVHGVFKAGSRATAGTTALVTPLTGGAIVLTDLIVTTDKVAGSTVTVRFTDGTETVDIVAAKCNDAPASFAIAFGGRWEGWKDARIDLVTVANVTANVALGYYKLKKGRAFAEWDALR